MVLENITATAEEKKRSKKSEGCILFSEVSITMRVADARLSPLKTTLAPYLSYPCHERGTFHTLNPSSIVPLCQWIVAHERHISIPVFPKLLS